MIQLVTCIRCKGFLALALRACPHCDAPLDRTRQALIGLAGLAGGGVVSMTLMACYGPGACVDNGPHCYAYEDASADAFIDGEDHSDAGSDAIADAPNRE